MDLEALKNALPDAAKDLRLNLAALDRITSLGAPQRALVLLASALASRHADTIRAAEAAAAAVLDERGLAAARTAHALMAMNNVYYRFTHLVNDPEIARLPAQLRMQGLANPGVEKQDFELACLAVSAIHGCGMCMESHTRSLLQLGATRQAIQDAVRIAAVVHAVGATLDAAAAGAPQANL